jgi:hypothetical protein
MPVAQAFCYIVPRSKKNNSIRQPTTVAQLPCRLNLWSISNQFQFDIRHTLEGSKQCGVIFLLGKSGDHNYPALSGIGSRLRQQLRTNNGHTISDCYEVFGIHARGTRQRLIVFRYADDSPSGEFE